MQHSCVLRMCCIHFQQLSCRGSHMAYNLWLDAVLLHHSVGKGPFSNIHVYCVQFRRVRVQRSATCLCGKPLPITPRHLHQLSLTATVGENSPHRGRCIPPGYGLCRYLQFRPVFQTQIARPRGQPPATDLIPNPNSDSL